MMEGPGEPVEWAVKMKRLPEEATFETRLQRGQVEVGLLKVLAALSVEAKNALWPGPGRGRPIAGRPGVIR
jgi:hypothetical protein